MKELKFANGIVMEVDDNSTPESILIYYDKFSDVDESVKYFADIDGAILDGVKIVNHIYVGTMAQTVGERIEVHFMSRQKSETELLREEIEMLKSSQNTQDLAIEDLGEAVSDLAGMEE